MKKHTIKRTKKSNKKILNKKTKKVNKCKGGGRLVNRKIDFEKEFGFPKPPFGCVIM